MHSTHVICFLVLLSLLRSATYCIDDNVADCILFIIL
jgi:hypothetical protein